MGPDDLGQNSLEDVSWLCSLSESELDLLICLKKLVLQRAGVIGHPKLADKFDLKVLRALAFVQMTFIKDKVQDLSLKPGFEDSAAFMENCNILKCELGDVMSLEEIGIHLRNAARKRFQTSTDLKETPSQKRQKVETRGV